MLGFGSNFGVIRKFVKCILLPFLFTYFDLSSSKSSEKYWADFENKVDKHFWQIFTPFRGFGMLFREKHFFSKYNELTVYKISNGWWKGEEPISL